MDRRAWYWAVLLGAAVLAAGCRQDTVGRGVSSPRRQARAAAEETRSRLLALDLESLQQHANGPGVIISDPVVRPGMDSASRDFAHGISAWLRLALASHPEFHKTPAVPDVETEFSALAAARRAPDLQAVSRRLAAYGVTHAGVGEAEAGGGRISLTYRLWQLSPQARQGSEVRLTGTPEEIVRGLPEAARQLAERAGARTPPATEVPETAEELRFIGTLAPAWRPQSPEQRQKLAEMAPRSPLACLYGLMGRQNASEPVGFDVRAALSRHQSNGQVLSAAGWVQVDPEWVERALEKLKQERPHTYIHHCGLLLLHSGRNDFARMAVEAAESARCNSGNREAWVNSAEAFREYAANLRKGRTADQISSAEWELLEKLYAGWLTGSRKGVEIDPDSFRTQFELCKAGVFTGSYQEADPAFWKSLKLAGPTDKRTLYFWGFEMYHPKWMDAPDQMARVAQAAVNDTFRSSEDRLYVAQLLHERGFQAQAGRVLRSARERQQFARWKRGEVTPAPPVARAAPAPAPARAAARVPLATQTPDGARRIGEHRAGVSAVAWSPDGQRLAACGMDRAVSLWSASGEAEGRLSGHQAPVVALAWSPDSRVLASADLHGVIRVWNPQTRQPVKSLQAGSRPVYALAWTSQPLSLVSGGDDGSLRAWDPTTWRARITRYRYPVRGVAPVPNGSRVAVATGWTPVPTVEIRDLSGGSPTVTIPLRLSELRPLAWSPDGKRLLLGTGQGTYLWSAEEPENTRLIQGQAPAPRPALAVQWSPDGTQAIVVDGSRKVEVVEVDTGRSVRVIQDPSNTLTRLSLDPRHRHLAGGGVDGSIWFWAERL